MILLTERPRLDARLLAVGRGGLPARGPQSVAASLQRGLRALELPFALNPRKLRSSGGPVGVLSGVEALRDAIAWKREAPGGRLIAGPNLVVLPSDAGGLITCTEIDLVLVPSTWVKDLYEEEAPTLRGRVAVWPAGVDPSYWAPAASGNYQRRQSAQPHALIYLKALAGQRNPSDYDLSQTRTELERAGFSHEQVEYGSYRSDGFLSALQRADLMVAFSPSESQGIGLLEAWSANTPTFVWAMGEAFIKGRRFETSSAPFLGRETGAEFQSSSELAELLKGFADCGGERFRPREWVLNNMTDSQAAKRYWDLAHGRDTLDLA